jgi:glycosyltransferase involved in cell wall biosynthesis
MSKPTVSVVIPVYNRPTAVRRAIDSVLSQTYRHFEMVVVDDASTDGTPVAVQAVSEPRVRLVRHETRLGGSAARNTGIRAGSAPFVAFLDSDDEWLPAKLERQLELFSKGGDRLGLVYTGTLQVTGSGARREVIPARHHNMARELLTRNVIGETSVGMVRRTVLDEVGVFDESLPSSQDLDLWLRIANRFETDFVPEALVRTTKLNVGERISSNPNAVIEGQDLFCRKHRREL